MNYKKKKKTVLSNTNFRNCFLILLFFSNLSQINKENFEKCFSEYANTNNYISFSTRYYL